MTLPDLAPAFVERHDVAPGSIRKRSASRRRRRRLGQAGAVAVLAAAVAAGTLLPGRQTAFADWTPEPGPLDERLVARAEQHCEDDFHTWAAPVADGEGVDGPSVEHAQAVYRELLGRGDALAPTVVDQRGNGFVALYLSSGGPTGSTVVTCVLIWDPHDPHAAPVGGSTGLRAVASFRASLAVLGWGSTDLPPLGKAGRFSELFGVAPEGVRVIVTLEDGQTVAARSADGHFLAWWPGKAEPVRVDAVDRDGRVHLRLDRAGGGRWSKAAPPAGGSLP
ncbi:MAG TPA: hypothetical protein VM324_03555 [Egibacteraceae bacterium]|nr:hypothetical protein [Egibacteraceae bacterium]